MTRGEDVIVLIDYDLFDLNVKDCRGIYLKTDNSGKHLVYFPINQEWGEVEPSSVSRPNPDFVPDENKSFVDRVEEMKITYFES